MTFVLIALVAVLIVLYISLALIAWFDRHDAPRLRGGNPSPARSREDKLREAYMDDRLDVFDFILAMEGVIDPLVSDGTATFVRGTDAPGSVFDGRPDAARAWKRRHMERAYVMQAQRAIAEQRYMRSIGRTTHGERRAAADFSEQKAITGALDSLSVAELRALKQQAVIAGLQLDIARSSD